MRKLKPIFRWRNFKGTDIFMLRISVNFYFTIQYFDENNNKLFNTGIKLVTQKGNVDYIDYIIKTQTVYSFDERVRTAVITGEKVKDFYFLKKKFFIQKSHKTTKAFRLNKRYLLFESRKPKKVKITNPKLIIGG